jgi:hypothetical protein
MQATAKFFGNACKAALQKSFLGIGFFDKRKLNRSERLVELLVVAA